MEMGASSVHRDNSRTYRYFPVSPPVPTPAQTGAKES